MLSDARSYLLRYGDLKLYIAAKRREIETLRESLLPQSVDYTGVTVQHSPSDHYAEIMAQIDQIDHRSHKDTGRDNRHDQQGIGLHLPGTVDKLLCQRHDMGRNSRGDGV